MDPFKLLSRSTKVSQRTLNNPQQHRPPSGRAAQPQLFSTSGETATTSLGKRKRATGSSSSAHRYADLPNFFVAEDDTKSEARQPRVDEAEPQSALLFDRSDDAQHLRQALDERKRILKEHKIKVTIVNSNDSRKPSSLRASKEKKANRAKCALFPSPLSALKDLKPRFDTSQRLSQNISDQGYAFPTEVQIAALPLLLDHTSDYMPDSASVSSSTSPGHARIDLLTVAPTGSGKTLAFVVPLIQSILSRRHQSGRQGPQGRQNTAIILAPTKELASQITNEGRKLSKGTGVTISLIRKGMRLSGGGESDTSTVSPFEKSSESFSTGTVIKADIIVSTPGVLQTIISEIGGPLLEIRNFILDEADVLLDPTFRGQTLAIWDSLAHPDLRVSMWSATMGSSIEELVVSTIEKRRSLLSKHRAINVLEAPIIRLVVGLKDSAIPNVSHRLIYAATEKGKIMGLRQLLNPSTSSADSGPALRPPFLIFTQTVERAIALSSELIYDVPMEAGGSSRIAVLHSDLSDTARDSIMTRFRKGEIWILITTDLLSRGVDFRGVNGVVNYDIPTSSAAYVHRIGRTGRAGRDGGVAITLYAKEDVPYLKHVANVVALSQRQDNGEGVQQWLLDALPKLSKNEKKNLKSRGIESRTAKGQKKDPKAVQKSRISTKAGFVRREENRRKGAVLGGQRRLEAKSRSTADDDDGDEDEDEIEFAGFD